MTDINVEDIMSEIRQEIKSKGYQDNELSFGEVEELRRLYNGDFDARELDDWMQIVRQQYYIEEHPTLWANTFFAKLKYRIKSLARKTVSFYVIPIVQKQNKYNKAVAKVLNQMDAYIDSYRKVEMMEKKIEELTKRVQELENKKEL